MPTLVGEIVTRIPALTVLGVLVALIRVAERAIELSQVGNNVAIIHGASSLIDGSYMGWLLAAVNWLIGFYSDCHALGYDRL